MNKSKPFLFSGNATPTGAETSAPIVLQEQVGVHVVIGHKGVGTAAVDYSADGGSTWNAVDNDGTPLVLTNDEAVPVLTTYAFRVRNLTGVGQCYINNPYAA